MKRRTFVASVAASDASLALAESGLAQEHAGTATPAEGETMMQTDAQSGLRPGQRPADVLRDPWRAGSRWCCSMAPLGRSTLWGPILATLAETRQVIAVELQATGTPPTSTAPSATSRWRTTSRRLMEHLGIAQADVVGYSMGGDTALRLAIRHPELVRKLVAVSATTASDGVYPEVLAGIQQMTPEIFVGTP